MIKKSTVFAAMTAALFLMGVQSGPAAERSGGASIEVNRGGVHVEIGAKGQSGMPAARVRDLLGVNVYNPAHESLGEIEDLVIDPSKGSIRYAVLSFGGFLGMGDKLFAVPWDDLKLVSKGTTSAGTINEDHYVLDVSKEALKNAPGFDKSNWPDFANRNWSADVDKFYTGQRGGSTRR